MLRKWRLRNFKSFYGDKDLALAPLTLISGANSSGKSTVIQSMLLIKQTVQYAPSSKPIALNGPLVRLGTYSDIESHQCPAELGDNSIKIGWTIERDTAKFPLSPVAYGGNRIKTLSLDFEFDTKGSTEDNETLEIQPSLKSISLKADFYDFEGIAHNLSIAAKRSSRRGRKLTFNSVSIDDTRNPFEYIVIDIDAETKARSVDGRMDGRLVGLVTRHFMPDRLVVRYDRNKEIAREVAHRVAQGRPSAPHRRSVIATFTLPQPVIDYLLTLIRHGLPSDARAEEVEVLLFSRLDRSNVSVADWVRSLQELPPSTRRSIQASLIKHVWQIESLLYENLGKDLNIAAFRDEALADALSASQEFFRFHLNYLGPLRDEPRPQYPLQALSTPTDVGIKGELTAAVLHLNEKRTIEYIPSSGFSCDAIDTTTSRARLRDAVVDWLKYMGVAIEIETAEKGKFGHELRVRINEHCGLQDLTNVGVGVSQVLPIVVMCLLAPVGSTIILEQPELHLHPAVQARLADFFISMSFLGKQCILETHGEYLVERIRFRIVSDDSGAVHNLTKIYFFEQKDGVTECREVSLTKYGAIEDWPDDFFDQSQKESERIVMKAMQRRNSERNRRAREDGSAS